MIIHCYTLYHYHFIILILYDTLLWHIIIAVGVGLLLRQPFLGPVLLHEPHPGYHR